MTKSGGKSHIECILSHCLAKGNASSKTGLGAETELSTQRAGSFEDFRVLSYLDFYIFKNVIYLINFEPGAWFEFNF